MPEMGPTRAKQALDFMSAAVVCGPIIAPQRGDYDFSPIGLALVRVFHLGERNPGFCLPGIFEVEGVACQENQIAVEILRDC